jgi:hypothetical protein
VLVCERSRERDPQIEKDIVWEIERKRKRERERERREKER